MTDNLYDLFESCFPANRDDIMIEIPDGAEYSYSDVEKISARYAHLLVDSGAKPGDRVAVQVYKSPEAVFLYLACLRAGLVYLPLNTAYKSAEVEYFLGDASPVIVVCDPADENEISRIGKSVV